MYEASPYALALIIADSVHREPGSGKCTILGTFSIIAANKFPASHGSLAVYFAVTDGRGDCEISVRLVLGDDDEVIAAVNAEVSFPDPRQVVEGVLILKGVVFPRAGEYRVQLLSKSELLLERRVLLKVINQ